MTDLHPALAVLRRVVHILALAALLIAGAADFAAGAVDEEPKVTIAAARESHGFGIDDVVFSLARTGSADAALAVRVTLGQDGLYLAEDRLDRTVAFAAGEDGAELRIPAAEFAGPATATGALRATLVDGDGYSVGRPSSATTRMVVEDPAISARPDRAGELPTLAIAAEREAIGYGIDRIAFTVAAEGAFEEALEAAVTVDQADSYVAPGNLTRTVRIEPGETEGTVLFPRATSATSTGTLTATIQPGDGYLVGTPASASIRVVVLETAMTIRPERASYRFVEGGPARAAWVARTEPGLPRPGGAVYATISSKTAPDGAAPPGDFRPVSEILAFQPGDFAAAGSVWEARSEVALDIHTDDEDEGEEVFYLVLERSASLSSRVELRRADGGACDGDCAIPVTIRDDPAPAATGLTIAPVPPAASAGHGPRYVKDEFLALPDGAVHGPGARLAFTLAFEEAVTVTGAPELVLDIWDRERRARYSGGSGTRRLAFAWTVAKGDNDPDGLEFRYLDLNGGRIADTDGHEFEPARLAAQHFPAHRVRGGLFAMRLDVAGPAREGEPLEIRVIRDGGYDEIAVAGVDVGDSALPHIAPGDHYVENGPGHRQFDFEAGAADEPGVRVSRRSVTPPGDGIADEARTLTIRLGNTDAGFHLLDGRRFRSWYRTEGALEATVTVVDTGLALAEAGLRVHRATAREAAGARLAFRVTLSPRSESAVEVGYRTGDDPHNRPGAVAGADYVAAEGTLTFQPGETVRTVEVEVLPDDHDEGVETMRLHLENPRGARIDVPHALGLIHNSGPIPKAWIARFGRAVADQVLGAVEDRIRAAREPGIALAVAGRRVGSGPPAPTGDPAASGFALTAQAGEGGRLALWGRGAARRFDGRAGALALDGEVASAMLGADWSRADGGWTAGLIVSHSRGEGGYAGTGRGRIEAVLTGLYPWGRLALSEDADVWAAAGYGAGTLAVTPGTVRRSAPGSTSGWRRPGCAAACWTRAPAASASPARRMRWSSPPRPMPRATPGAASPPPAPPSPGCASASKPRVPSASAAGRC